MKINDIYESTTAGAIATVATPMTTQSRNASIYGGKKAGNLLTGKKTNKKYANSVNESSAEKFKVQIICDDGGKTSYTVSAETKEEALRKATKIANRDGYEDFEAKIITESKMKELAMDIRNMDNGNFQKKYKKSKEQIKFLLGDPEAKKTVHENDGPTKYKVTYFNPKLDRNITKTVTAKNESDIWDHCANKGLEVVSIEPAKKAVHEAHLDEDDVIIVPGQGHRLKSGFIPHDKDRTDHEVEMAKSDLFQAAKNAKQVYELIHDVTEDEGLEGWVQEKIIKANDYLNTVREYLEGKQLQHNEMGVIAGGAGNFEEEAKGLWANIHAKRERIKKGSGERMRKPGSKGAPTAQNFRDAAK